MSKKVQRYFYYIVQVDENYAVVKEIIIKATGFTEALSLTKSKFNDKLDYDKFSDYSQNIGLTIRRIKKSNFSDFPDAKRVKNWNYERSKLKAFQLRDKGMGGLGDRSSYIITIYEKSKKKAIKYAAKLGYDVKKSQFYYIEKTKNDYK